jgi:hypothetical protein
MIEFKKENYYEVKADTEKNRYYMTILGSWEGPEAVPDYLDQTKKALGKLKPGFDVLNQILDTKPPKLSLTKLHNEVQKTLIKAGVSRVACVVPKLLSRVSLNVINKFVGMNLKTFSKKEDAIKWLEAEASK